MVRSVSYDRYVMEKMSVTNKMVTGGCLLSSQVAPLLCT